MTTRKCHKPGVGASFLSRGTEDRSVPFRRGFFRPAAGEATQPLEMRRQLPVIGISQIKRQQIAQAAINLVKIQARAIKRNMARAIGMLRFSRNVLDRPD